MKTNYLQGIWALLLFLAACDSAENTKTTQETMKPENKVISGYAPLKGLNMYYEIRGEGVVPLVLIHGGGSTIESTFGRVIDSFAKTRKVIAMELQSHGHTEDIDRPLSFEQDADDIAALLQYLKVESADFFGFSNGGTTTLQIAIRHPKLVRKAVVASAIYRRDGTFPQFWDFMKQAKQSPMPVELEAAYKKVAPDTANLNNLHYKCVDRVLGFEDIPDAAIKAIQAPILIVISDADVATPEHAVALYRLLKHGSIAILPGGHGEYIGEVCTLSSGTNTYMGTVKIIEAFLDKPLPAK
jgi:pimeloyl-ACP methyl ester carboxylesterase